MAQSIDLSDWSDDLPDIPHLEDGASHAESLSLKSDPISNIQKELSSREGLQAHQRDSRPQFEGNVAEENQSTSSLAASRALGPIPSSRAVGLPRTISLNPTIQNARPATQTHSAPIISSQDGLKALGFQTSSGHSHVSSAPIMNENNRVGPSYKEASRTSAIKPLHQNAEAGPSNLYKRIVASRSAVQESDTETEVDSDSTFVPGRSKSKAKQSLSQPDLVALRSRLGGWAGDVAREQSGSSSKPRRKVSPNKNTSTSPQSPVHNINAFNYISQRRNKSSSSLQSLRRSPSPKSSPTLIAPLTPLLAPSPIHSDSSSFEGRLAPVGGMTGSEDGDDSLDDTDSITSGSLAFTPKRVRHRGRMTPEKSKSGLGLSFDPEPSLNTDKAEDIPAIIERRLQQSTLLSLRLLAIVPSLWGICVLLDGLLYGKLWIDVWPWGVDLSTEALERLVAGSVHEDGTWRKVSRGDMVLSILWALCTAHFCFELTTGLTHRWRSYYPLLSTLLRLLSLQCLCWPATYMTLWFLGAHRPLLAWIVIGVTTGWSRTVQMWVTSNVIPGETTPMAKSRLRSVNLPSAHESWWERFTWARQWDWDAIAREVGWKIGALLLITTAWLFWSLETGRLVEV